MINLIGISGKIGSGKDTVAHMIREITENDFQIKRFAGKLKQIAELLTGIPAADMDSQEVKSRSLGPDWHVFEHKPKNGGTPVLPVFGKEVSEREMTLRELLQKLGTDAIRDKLHEDAWVNALFADWREGCSWIIPDVRFPNEYNAIKKRGGIVIRLTRFASISAHPSETALDNHQFDWTIHNTGSIEELRKSVITILNKENIIGLPAEEIIL